MVELTAMGLPAGLDSLLTRRFLFRCRHSKTESRAQVQGVSRLRRGLLAPHSSSQKAVPSRSWGRPSGLPSKFLSSPPSHSTSRWEGGNWGRRKICAPVAVAGAQGPSLTALAVEEAKLAGDVIAMGPVPQSIASVITKYVPRALYAWLPFSEGAVQLLIRELVMVAYLMVLLGVCTPILQWIHSIDPLQHLSVQGEKEDVPYELGVWAAMEWPLKLIAGVYQLTHIASLIAPSVSATTGLLTARRLTLPIAAAWFLFRWKTSMATRILNRVPPEQGDQWLALDKLLSAVLIALGLLAVAEAAGVAFNSFLAVGGVGGVAAAFAGKDILGNFLSGLVLQIQEPFRKGDFIKAGSVEGEILGVGFLSTTILNQLRIPTTVPNSYFGQQIIENRSRCRHRGFETQIPIKLEDVLKAPGLTDNVRKMMFNHPLVYLDREKPRCYLSGIKAQEVTLSLMCNIKPMKMDQYVLATEDITYKIAQIVASAGAEVGGSYVMALPRPAPTSSHATNVRTQT